TVRFSSSDPQATLPGSYTFTAGDAGVHTFSATLRTAGSQSITATDGNASGTQLGIVVNAAAATSLLVSGFPSPTAAGALHTFTIAAKDPYGNPDPNYRGTVHITSSDPQATLPDDYTFTADDAGLAYFGAVLRTAGRQAILATDGPHGGSQINILVTPL